MHFEETKGRKYNKINITQVKSMNIIKVFTKQNKAKATFKAAKALHNKEIKQFKQNIRKHKLLKKQARLVYKLSK